ncbi:CatB-related O-acetyltransferase [Arthrobacter sp. MMS24-T111]
MGKHTYGNPSVRVFEHDDTKLSIGAYTSIAHEVQFLLGGNHPTDRVTTFPLRIRLGLEGAGSDGYPSSPGNINVGSDVWIGARTLVLAGVNIGDGAVIGAGSLVSRDVPPYSICVGQPARPVKFRIPQELIGPMLSIKWWEWDDATVERLASELSGTDVEGFVKKFGKLPAKP